MYGESSPRFVCFRVREGGERSDEFETERGAFACMFGGEDGRTLFTCEADWLGRERMDTVIARRAGQVRMVRVPAPHAGYPLAIEGTGRRLVDDHLARRGVAVDKAEALGSTRARVRQRSERWRSRRPTRGRVAG